MEEPGRHWHPPRACRQRRYARSVNGGSPAVAALECVAFACRAAGESAFNPLVAVNMSV